jgi:hypothetical protein
MRHGLIALLTVLASASAAVDARATLLNSAPPPGAAFDLAGTPVPDDFTYRQYSFQVTYSGTGNAALTMVFRHDPGGFGIDDVSVRDNAAPGGELLQNGGFESVTGDLPDHWTVFQQTGISFAGFVSDGSDGGLQPHGGNNFWADGAAGGYDGLSQSFAAQQGHTYTMSFWLQQQNAGYVDSSTFRQVATNAFNTGQCAADQNLDEISQYCGNGIDVLLYFPDLPSASPQDPPAPAPEPGSLALLGGALLVLGGLRRRV